MADILQEYLSLGLLDIGDDDTRLSKLRDAAADLQKRFTSEPRISLYHALMVYSPNADPEDECFLDDAAVLSNHWQTYSNRHRDAPREIFRAISLQAVTNIVENDPVRSAAITYGLRSMDRHPVDQKDGALLQRVYLDLESKVEANAVTKWDLNATSLGSAFSEVVPARPEIKADVTSGDVATIAEHIASGTNAALKVISDQLTATVNKAQNKFRDVAISTTQRSELLWWKASLYSRSLGKSYRDVPAGVAALFMAIDLHLQIGPITPLSVDFFLRETVTETLSDTPSLSWGELISQFASEGYGDKLIKHTPTLTPRVGVRTIVERLQSELQAPGSQSGKAPKGSKIKKADSINLGHLAVKAFLALQALRATTL